MQKLHRSAELDCCSSWLHVLHRISTTHPIGKLRHIGVRHGTVHNSPILVGEMLSLSRRIPKRKSVHDDILQFESCAMYLACPNDGEAAGENSNS
jgi:hypothetical protein